MTFTLFICFKDCAQVLGVEIQEEAILLAKLNAIKNGIENTRFYFGKAEEVLNRPEFQTPDNADDVVAIIDPPRAGLRKQFNLFIIYNLSAIKQLCAF